MRNYIPIVKLVERDPAWADRVRDMGKRKQRRYRADPHLRAKMMRKGIKGEARRKGVEFHLPLEWFEEKLKAGVCEASGVGFNFEKTGKGIAAADAPSVDRIIAGGHYTVENCRMILFSINQAKGSWGHDYIVDVFRRVIERQA